MLWQMAVRNLWRNWRRTLLTMSALVISVSLLILSLGVFSGMFADMLASATQQYHGHIVISKLGYQEQRQLHDTMQYDQHVIDQLQATSDVYGVSPRLRGFGLLSRDEQTEPAELLGIEPGRERQVTSLNEMIVAGVFPEETRGNWIVLGSGLADKLEVIPGDELVFVTQAADGSIGNDLLIVRGVFKSGDFNRDNSLALVSLAWLQQLLVLPEMLHEISLSINTPMEATPVAKQLAMQFPDTMEVIDWGRLLPEMQEAIASYDVSRLILVLILYAAAGLGVLNTFFMSVLERVREFGVLLAIGMKPSSIRNLVLLESLILGGLSLLVGSGSGVLLTVLLSGDGIDLSRWMTAVTYAGGTIPPRLRAELVADNLLIPCVTLLLVSLFAGYLPARRASRLRPIAALRGD
ncbi:MAG: ABC transporter permease [Desulfuromonas sp.]|jgi:ABC-type lipoprotein release transport system permease subunit|nr:MAG: ABC transporter permease [Desulfuromonas sp.]